MTNHVKVYIDYMRIKEIYPHEFKCEQCHRFVGVSGQIHHVTFRSKFGKKRKEEQDSIENLICLCASCHSKVHDKGTIKEEALKEIIRERHENDLNRLP